MTASGSDRDDARQPDIPVSGNTPAAADPATANPRPPSSVLNRDPGEGPGEGMVSQADMADAGGRRDEALERQRRDNLNPSLAREEPVDEGGTDEDASAARPAGEPARGREGRWKKDPEGRESSDHSNMNPDDPKGKDL